MVVKTDALEQQVQPALPHARSLPLGDMAAAPALPAEQVAAQIWGAPGASETIVTSYGGLFYLISTLHINKLITQSRKQMFDLSGRD